MSDDLSIPAQNTWKGSDDMKIRTGTKAGIRGEIIHLG